MELHQDLAGTDPARQHVGEHGVLGAFDVHLDQVRRRQPQHAREGGEAVHRCLHGRPGAVAPHQAEGGKLPLPRRGEARGAVEVGDAVGVEDKPVGEQLRRRPVEGDRRGVEGVHHHAAAGDQVALEADVGAHAEGVDDAARAESLEGHGPAAAGVAQGHGVDRDLGAAVHIEPEE